MSSKVSSQVIRFSIRELLIATAAASCILVGFTYFGLFGASTITLVFGIVLLKSGRKTKRRWMSMTGVTLSLLSFVTASMAMVGWIFLGIGPIYSVSSYPYGLKDMAEIASADIAHTKVAGLGSFIDSEHVWRLSLSLEQLELVIAEFGLVAVGPKNVPAAFRQTFPFLWRPPKDSKSLYYSTPEGFPALSRGPDGDYYFAMYHSQTQQLYVWHKSNF